MEDMVYEAWEEIRELKAEIERLRVENASLIKENDYLKAELEGQRFEGPQ